MIYMVSTPIIIEQTDEGERVYDIYSRMMKERVLFLTSAIDDETANVLIAQLLFLDQADSDAKINLYINCPGGSVSAGLAIYDTMQSLKCKVATVCMGQAASMAAVLLAAGSKGHRTILPSARVMIHQPTGGCYGQVTDVEIATTEMRFVKKKLTKILAKHTGQKKKKITKDTERDTYLSAKDSVAYGLVDKVIK